MTTHAVESPSCRGPRLAMGLALSLLLLGPSVWAEPAPSQPPVLQAVAFPPASPTLPASDSPAAQTPAPANPKVAATSLPLAPSEPAPAEPGPDKVYLHIHEPVLLLAPPVPGAVSGPGDAEVTTVGLPEVVQRVLSENLDVAIAQSRVQQARGQLVGAIAPLLPSLNASQSVERFNGGEIVFGRVPVNLERTTYRPTLSASYDIQTGGRDIFQLRASHFALKRQSLAETQATQETLLQAASRYYEWLFTRASVDVARQAVEEAEAQVALNSSKRQAGFGTQLDVLQSQTQLQERNNDLLKARCDESVAQVSLMSVLNLPLSKLMQPVDGALQPVDFHVLPEAQTEGAPALSQMLAEARQHRPDLRQLEAQVSEGKALLATAYAEFLPTVNVNAFVRGIGPEMGDLQRTTRGMLMVSMDVLRNLGVGNVGNVMEAKARLKELTLRREKQLLEMERTIAQTYLDYKRTQSQLSLYAEKLRTVEAAYQIALARLRTGVGINLEVIQAQSQLSQARGDQMRATKEFNQAQLQLLYQLGRLTPETLLASEPLTPGPVAQAPGALTH